MTRFPAALIALALIAAPSLAKAAGAPFAKTFKDWEVSCDNIGDCMAFGFAPEKDRPSDIWLRLSLKAGPAARPTLKGQAEGVDVGGARILNVPPEFARLAPADQLVAMARKEEVAIFSSTGKARATFSLAGLSAALLAIDEAQGRLGSQVALIRKGDKPAASVPGPRPLPKVTPVPTASFGKGDARLARALSALQPKSFAEDCPRQSETRGAGAVYPLSKTLSLIALECDSGAYNMMTRYWLAPDNDPRRATPLILPDASGEPARSPEGAPDSTLINADYDPARGVLAYFSKGRGIGDCGASASYAWTGRRFELAEFSQMGECAGVPPDDWASLFRSRP